MNSLQYEVITYQDLHRGVVSSSPDCLRHSSSPYLTGSAPQYIIYKAPCKVLGFLFLWADLSLGSLRNLRLYLIVRGRPGQALPKVIDVQIGLDFT